MKAKKYKVRKFIAKARGIPRTFVAIVLRETAKALWLYGHGTVGDLISCCCCGRTLTHPVSRLVGIGPECGKHYWDESVLGPYGFTEEHAEILKKMVHNIKIGPLWIPKSAITTQEETDEEIERPNEVDHGRERNGQDHRDAEEDRGKDRQDDEDRRGKREGETARGARLDHRRNRPVRQPRPDDKRRPSSRQRCARSATLTTDRQIIEVRFPYNERDLQRVRTLNLGRPKFVKNRATGDAWWNAVAEPDNYDRLREWDFSFDERTKAWYNSLTEPSWSDDQPNPSWMDDLYPFQRAGVRYLEGHLGRAIVGDEMGLGKTVQALAYLRLHPECLPAVVVCPATIKENWRREAVKWSGLSEGEITVMNGRPTGSEDRRPDFGRLVIINYDILSNRWTKPEGHSKRRKEIPGTGWVDHFVKAGFRTAILDESHYVKNPKVARTKAVLKLTKKLPHVICLTGTPIKNRPIEILVPTAIVQPGLFPSAWDFKMRYCGPKHNGFGWDFSGASNTGELHVKLTKSCMIRRLKEDVLPDLPAKTRSVVPLRLDRAARERYGLVEEDILAWLMDHFDDSQEAVDRSLRVNALSKFEYLKQSAVEAKIDACVDWIRDVLETDEKLVVYCHHKETVAALVQAFGDACVVVDGGTPNARRVENVDRFQTDDSVRLFVGTQAAKEGITLTASSKTAFLELWWTPGDHDQAEDRVHRIGQDDSVWAYYLIAEDTIEEVIARLLDRKRVVTASVLDGKEVDDSDLLTQLISELVPGRVRL